MNAKKLDIVFVLLALVAGTAYSQTTYTWTQTAGGAQDWTIDANWSGSLVPSPVSGDTMDFSTVDITDNTTLTLGADRTATTWKFGDATTADCDWIVNSGNLMILAGTTPTINMVNRTATLNNVLDGTAGLTKSGTGTLILTGANTYSGTTTLSAGTLELSGGDDRLATSGSINFSANSTLSIVANQTLSNVIVADNKTGTVNGGGGLTLIGASFSVGGAANVNNTFQTLDMSGLSTFTYTNSTGAFKVGGTWNTASSTANQFGTLTMPGVATITASSFGVGNTAHWTTGTGKNTGTLNLGGTTTIHADTITLGESNADGTIKYASAKVSPSLVLRGSDGSSPVGSMTIADNGGKQTNVSSLLDLTTNVSGGSGGLDAKITTLLIGQWNRWNVSSTTDKPITTGELRMGLGTLEATTITIGKNGGNSRMKNGTLTTGILSVTGGTVKANTLTIGDQNSSANYNAVTGIFNLDGGGTLTATTVSKGNSAGQPVTRTFNWRSGTLGNISGTDLTWTGIPITLFAGTHTFDISGSNTATLDAASPIGGAFAITKDGPGTLKLAGVNTYSGATIITNGTLLGVAGGSCANSDVTVSPASGSASVGVSVTDNTKKWTCKSLTMGGSGSTGLAFDFGGTTPSTTDAPLRITGNLTFAAGAPAVVVSATTLLPIGSYPLLIVEGATVPYSVPTVTLQGGGEVGRYASLAWGGLDNKTLILTVNPAGTLVQFM